MTYVWFTRRRGTPLTLKGPRRRVLAYSKLYLQEPTSDQQETGLQLLEEDDSLSSESASQKDEDGAGDDGALQLGLLGSSLSSGTAGGKILSGVPLGSLRGNGALALAELLDDGSGNSCGLLLHNLPVLLEVLRLLAADGTSGELLEARDQLLVAGSSGLSCHLDKQREKRSSSAQQLEANENFRQNRG